MSKLISNFEEASEQLRFFCFFVGLYENSYNPVSRSELFLVMDFIFILRCGLPPADHGGFDERPRH